MPSFKMIFQMGLVSTKILLEVYYLEVDINGKTTRGAEVPKEEYEFTSSSNKLNIAFQKETE